MILDRSDQLDRLDTWSMLHDVVRVQLSNFKGDSVILDSSDFGFKPVIGLSLTILVKTTGSRSNGILFVA